jgi:sensor histidine kinase YesM
MKTRQVYRYITIVAMISIAMSLLVHFNSIMAIFSESTRFHGNSGNASLANVLSEVFITFLVAFFTFLLNFYIIKPLDGLRKLGLKRILFSIVLTLISVYLLSDLFFAVKHLINGIDNPKKFILLFFFRDLFMAALVLTCVLIIKVFYEKQAILLENEKLILENLQSQYQSLKNQVSPHFLFNSLTALTELISEEPVVAKQYVSHLSQVLRYTLQSNENQTACLRDEVDSVKSYMFLVEMRYSTNLKIDFKTGDAYNNYRLPPLTIQTLIENAVKHNEISKRNPLIINVFTNSSGNLIVSNAIREKLSPEPGTGIGLTNLSKQYKLLCGQDILISRSDREFFVEVPLLKPKPDENNNS